MVAEAEERPWYFLERLRQRLASCGASTPKARDLTAKARTELSSIRRETDCARTLSGTVEYRTIQVAEIRGRSRKL